MTISKRTFLNTPELHIGIFAFLLHFVWELLQMPLFAGFENAYYYDIVLHCTQATFGDVVISLIAFWSASLMVKSRFWILPMDRVGLLVFLIVGLVITIVFEALATGALDRWDYADAMPVLPLLGTGLAPVAQWVLVPLLQLWFVRRQLLGGQAIWRQNPAHTFQEPEASPVALAKEDQRSH
jgi:hypothetical protein